MTVGAAVPAVVENAEDERIALAAKALGHPARVRIVRLLLGSEACFCGEIVHQMPLAQATVSQHLKVLRESGLVVACEVEPPRTCYCVDRERLAELRELLGDLLEQPIEPGSEGRDGGR